jgi:hypothetical protein
MMHVTQDELLQYLYKETNPEKTTHIQQILETDEDLRERFNVLKSAKIRLDKIKLISPDDRSVDTIFNYRKPGIEIEL